MIESRARDGRGTELLVGPLSGRTIGIPDVNAPPMPALAAGGIIHNGQPTGNFGGLDASRGYPDARSYRRKFGLLVPATNTSMEHDLWSVVLHNRDTPGFDGIGLHTTPVITPRPTLDSPAALLDYRNQFLGGLRAAVDIAQLAQPQYLILGMSLEHILCGMGAIRASMQDIESYTSLSWATWHDAIVAALGKYRAKRIGLLTPFDQTGNRNAAQMFTDMGVDVVSSVGFSCANALHIAHVPRWLKERAILQLLATRGNELDAIVQCGTNMSVLDIVESLEPVIGIPILGINLVTFWYALRENGFANPLAAAGRLLREF